MLTNTSDVSLTSQPIPVWNLTRVVRLCDSAESVRMTKLMDGKEWHLNKHALCTNAGAKKGLFWKSEAPAINNAVLQHKLSSDGENSAHLEDLDRIECGCVPPLSRVHHYDGVTGMHLSLGYWIRQDGATSKAASPAPPPSVQGLAQRFEQLSMRNATSSA